MNSTFCLPRKATVNSSRLVHTLCTCYTYVRVYYTGSSTNYLQGGSQLGIWKLLR